MAKTLKKALALFLAVVMVLSTVGMTSIIAAADDTAPTYQTGIATAATAQKASDGTSSKVEPEYAGKVEVSKTITPIANTTDFNVELKVIAKTEDVHESIANPLAVCLVVDLSGSMNDKINGTKKIDSAKAAAKSFVETLDENCYVSIVTFNNEGAVKQNWTRLSGNGRQTVKNAISALKAESDTASNMDDGFIKARELFAASPVSGMSNDNKFTVLLSDGRPTYAMWDVHVSDVCDSYSVPNAITAAELNNIRNNHTYVDKGWAVCENCGKWYGLVGHKHGTKYVKITDNTFTGFDYDVFGDGSSSSKNICDATLVDTAKLPGNKYAIYIGNLSDKCYDNYTVNDLFKAITGSESKVIGVSNISTLTTTLNGLATTINDSHDGNSGNGWIVTDTPNTPYIKIVPDASNSAITANGIVWNLAGATPVESTSGNTTTKTYTYTLNYKISLDTEAQGFAADTEYDTSAPAATLKKPADTRAMSTMENSDPNLVATFNNPTVKGTPAKYYYAILVAVQTSGDNYTTSVYESGSDFYGAQINLPEESAVLRKAGISLDAYTKVEAPTLLTIQNSTTNTSANTVTYKYNRKTTSVTVKHHYKDYGWNDDGSYTSKDEASEVVSSASYPTSGSVLYVNDPFTATEQTAFNSKDYTFDGGDKTISKLAQSGNEINLYYSYEYDNCDATLVVNHYFKTKIYELVNGSYELVEGSYGNPVEAQNIKGKSNTNHGITLVPKDSGFTSDDIVKVEVEKGGTLNDSSTSINLAAGENIVNVYFEKEVDNRTPATVTVKHVYTTYTYSVDENGQLSTQAAQSSDTVEKEITGYYVGETITIEEDANGFTSDSGNANKLSHTIASANDAVTLNYSKTVYPDASTVTVKHIYIDYTTQVVTTYDEDGNATGFTTKTSDPVISEPVEVVYGEDGGLYAGQKVNIEKATSYNDKGYTFDETRSDDISDVRANGQTITLYYTYTNALGDTRTDTTWDVTHSYYVNVTGVNENGVIETKKNSDGQVTSRATTDKVGNSVTLEPVTSYNNNEYSLDPANTELTKILQNDGNSFTLNYIRDYDNLIPVTASVTYEYYERYMYINEDNEAVYGDWALVEDLTAEGSYTAAVENTGDYANSIYAGQYITAASGATDEYSEDISDTAYNQKLGENNWSFTYKYGKYVALDKGTVTVKYNYKDITIAIDGTESSVESTGKDYNIDDKYVGQRVTATSDSKGRELVKVLINGEEQDKPAEVDVIVGEAATTVEYFYEYTNDNSVPANYVITYVENTYDYNVKGESYLVSSVSTSDDDAVNSFATKTAAVNVGEHQGFDFVDITFNGESIFEAGKTSYAPVLAAGDSAIVIVYEKQLDTREDTDVNVVNSYTKKDTFKNTSSVVKQTVSTFTGKENGIWVGARYEFNESLLNNEDDSYSFVGVTPDVIDPLVGRVLHIADDAVVVRLADQILMAQGLDDELINVFTVTYESQYSTKANNVIVNHNYYTTGVITGEKKLVKTIVDDRDYLATLSAGDSFEVDPMTELDGNVYDCTSETLSFTLDGDVNYKNVFNVDYNRVVPETIAATPGTITHEYYVVKGDKKTAEGTQTTTVNGNIGDTVTVEPVLTYNGNSYKLVPNQNVNVDLGSGVNDITLQYVRNEYEVKFNSNGGTEVEPQSVKESEKAVKPADPTRDGYSFNGWFSDSDLTKAYSFEDGVTADTELFAGWNVVNNNNPAPVNPTPNYPTVYPTVPQTPAEVEEELPEDEVPLAELPEEELPEDEVPLAAAPSVEEEELEEDLVPLGDAPATGDSSMIFIYAIVMLVSACGLVAIALTSRKKREEDC